MRDKTLKRECCAEFLCCAIIALTLFGGFFTLNFNAPKAIFYIGDVLNIAVLIVAAPQIFRVLKERDWLIPLLILGIALIGGTLSALANGFAPLRWAWAIRNWGRFFSFFFVCVSVLKKNFIDKMMAFFMCLFHVNFAVMLIQFFFFGISGDAANGLIGRDTSSVNLVFILIITVLTIARFQTKKINFVYFAALMLEIAVMNIIAELKGNFVFMLILIFAMYAVNIEHSVKGLLKYICILLLGAAFVYAGMCVIVKVYPAFSDILTAKGFMRLINSEKGYGNSGYYDRLNGISVTNMYFFKSNPLLKCLGFGIGNTEYSAFSFLTSPFYNMYGSTYRYLNFSLPILYLECGMLGVISFFAFHIVLLERSMRQIIRKNVDLYYWNVGFGMILIATMLIVYNNLHRTDVAFLLAMMCAIPFAMKYEGRE